MRTVERLLLFTALLLVSGCMMRPAKSSYEANSETMMLSGFVIYQDSAGSLSYHSPAGKDVLRAGRSERVEGRACQRGIQLPIYTGEAIQTVGAAWGDGAYRAALEDAYTKVPAGAGLFDVRADVQLRSILMIYREQCLIVNAAVFTPS